MKKCNVNGNHFYSDHLTHCPWCEIRKDTGKDPFPDSTGLQMTMPAPITRVSTPVSKSAQLKTNIQMPTPAPTPRGYYKVATFFVLAIIILLIFTTFNNTQKMAIPSVSNPISQSPVIATIANQKDYTNSIGMEFVLIPAGEFDMGSPSNEAGRFINEGPVHHVKISKAFYIGKYEVTQKQWLDVMGNNPSNFKGDNLPVEMVSWNDAQDFIKKLNEKEGWAKFRLPTEAEWEYSARAGITTRYSFGDAESMLGDYAWYFENSDDKTHPVGKKKPNPWGLYDIHGNIWEWVQDEWHEKYNGAPTDGSAWETGDGSIRIFRGGGWRFLARDCRSANRNPSYSGVRSDVVGFRVLRIL
jgi:formylglycine-generating enzyme required for sulfatase activity